VCCCTVGQNSPEVQNTLNQLRALRARRNGSTVSATTVSASGSSTGLDGDDYEDEDDELQYTIMDESKHRINSLLTGDKLQFQRDSQSLLSSGSSSTNGHIQSSNSSSGSRGLSSTVPSNSTRIASPQSLLTDDEEVLSLRLTPGDSMARLVKANEYFEQGRYSCADLLLSQAHQIISHQSGPHDPNLKAIQGNLNISRQNRINQLWLQVVAELVMTQEESSCGSSTSSSASTQRQDAASQSQHSAADQSAIDDYAGIMGKSFSSDELAFVSRTASSQSVCSIC
jgi:hypothetical protein